MTKIKKNKNSKKNDLYPILYMGSLWEKKDCDDVFISHYHSKFQLGSDMSVYVAEDERVKPDGSWV